MDEMEGLLGAIRNPQPPAEQPPPEPSVPLTEKPEAHPQFGDLLNKIANPNWQQEELNRARQSAPAEDAALRVGSRIVPFISALSNATTDSLYKESVGDYQKGDASSEQIKLIAGYEKRRKEEADQGTGGKLTDALLHIPAMVGEAVVVPGGNASSWMGRAAIAGLKTPLMPSMYLGEASRKSVEQGGDIASPQNLAPALGFGAVQNAVLGSAPGLASGIKNPVARFLAKVGLGAGELEASKAGISAIDEFLPEAYKTNTKYGAIGQALRGKWGEAAQTALVDTVTMAAFTAMHGNKYEAKQIVEGLKDKLDDLHKQGATPDQAAAAVQQEVGPIKQAVEAKTQQGQPAPQGASPAPEQQIPSGPYAKWPDADLIGIAKGLGMKKGETRDQAAKWLKEGGISEELLDQFHEAPKQSQVIQPEKPPEAAPEPVAETPAPEAAPVQPVATPPEAVAPQAQAPPVEAKAPETQAKVEVTPEERRKNALQDAVDVAQQNVNAAKRAELRGQPKQKTRMMEEQLARAKAALESEPAARPMTEQEKSQAESDAVAKNLDILKKGDVTTHEAAGLTPEESDIHFGLTLEGKSTRQLAEERGVSHETIRTRSIEANRKLDVRNEDGSVMTPAQVGKDHALAVVAEAAKNGLKLDRKQVEESPKAAARRVTQEADKEDARSELWLEFFKEADKRGTRFTPEQYAELNARHAAGEEPPSNAGPKYAARQRKNAKRASVVETPVRPGDTGELQEDRGQRPEPQAQEAERSQGQRAGADAGGPEAAGDELKIPEATHAMLRDVAGSGNKYYMETVRRELTDMYGKNEANDAIKAARKAAKENPPEGPTGYESIESRGKGTLAQDNATILRGELRERLQGHQTGEEYENAFTQAKRSGRAPAEAERLLGQVREENLADGRAKGIERIARETGHDPEELAGLLATEHGDTAFDPESFSSAGPESGASQTGDGSSQPTGTAEPITGGGDFGRPVTAEEREGVLPGGGQPDSDEMRAGGPEKIPEEPKKYTALQNSEVDKERIKNGLPPLMEAARQSNPETWDKAMAALDKDPEAGAKLVESLAKNPRATTVEENALLLQRKIALSNEHKRATLDYIKAFKEKADVITMDELDARERGLFGQIDQLDKVTRSTGTEWGRAGQFRRQLAAEDFSLGKMLLDAIAAKGRPLTPEEKLKINEMSEQIKDLQEKLNSAEDKLKNQKPGSKVYGEWTEARAALKRKTGQWQDSLKGDKDANRPFGQKMEDWLVKMRRAFVISSPTTMAKIVAASAERLGIAPIEEAVGGAIRQIPGMAKIAAAAPREGKFSVATEGRAFASAWSQGLIDAWQTLKTGKSDIDALHGKDYGPRSWLDLPGIIHAAGKAPAVRAEYTRSFLNRIDTAVAQGKDATSPAAMIRFGAEAYKDSQRAKFQQDNRVIQAYQKGIDWLKAKDASPGARAIGTAAQLALPVVKIPTNLVAETVQYATGLVTGSARAGIALAKGVENLKPQEADLIMRSLKKGVLGSTAMAIGYFNPQMFGGFYSGKRDENDVAAGGIKTPSGTIPSWLLHNPLLEVLQLGAAMRRATDGSYRGKGEGVVDAVGAGIAGLAEEVPFTREAIELGKMVSPSAKERGYAFGQFAKSMAVPQLVQWLAGQTDKNAKGDVIKRNPATVGQHIKTGIPGLRQTVPAK